MKFILNFFKKNQKKQHSVISHKYKSHEYEKKLALIVNQTEEISKDDIKYVEITKLDTSAKDDLFNAYRLDFSTIEKLKIFKKKYMLIKGLRIITLLLICMADDYLSKIF